MQLERNSPKNYYCACVFSPLKLYNWPQIMADRTGDVFCTEIFDVKILVLKFSK